MVDTINGRLEGPTRLPHISHSILLPPQCVRATVVPEYRILTYSGLPVE